MWPKHLLPALLLIGVFGAVIAQSVDDLPTLDEEDNQTPLESPAESEDDKLEGSGAGVIDEPIDPTTAATKSPILEDIETTTELPTASDDLLCPQPCTCSVEGEGDAYSFTVNCASTGLTELPSEINTKTTTLRLENNHLTEIPKSIASLTNLKELNAENNSIMELNSGSVSELTELKVLKLANNRLLEYPQELKNGFKLTKLEEIDLGGNDIRLAIDIENFATFTKLQKVVLPKSEQTDASELLCESYKNNLKIVCVGTCTENSHDCSDAPEFAGDEFMEATLPGTISLSNELIENSDLNGNSNNDGRNVVRDEQVTTESSTTHAQSSTDGGTEPALRFAVNKENIALSNTIIEEPKDNPAETDVKVGATTSDTNTGSVDKSVIGLVIAGMILIIAGVMIKKNWSSIRQRFSSTPTPAAAGSANGTKMPEEMPLQDKSPV